MFRFKKQPFVHVFQNRCSENFRNIHRKTPVLESRFDKVEGRKVCNFIKKRLQYRCFPVSIAKFLGTIFYRKPPVVAVSVFLN